MYNRFEKDLSAMFRDVYLTARTDVIRAGGALSPESAAEAERLLVDLATRHNTWK